MSVNTKASLNEEFAKIYQRRINNILLSELDGVYEPLDVIEQIQLFEVRKKINSEKRETKTVNPKNIFRN